MVAGQERVIWNPALSIPAKQFEFTDPEVARMKAALQTWDSYGANADRRWLQPLGRGSFLAGHGRAVDWNKCRHRPGHDSEISSFASVE